LPLGDLCSPAYEVGELAAPREEIWPGTQRAMLDVDWRAPAQLDSLWFQRVR
jgi:hypothetical protein